MAWLRPDRNLESRCLLLAKKIGSVSERFSTVKSGTVVVKLHNGFQWVTSISDDYRFSSNDPVANSLFAKGLKFLEAGRVVLVDSVISDTFLETFSDRYRPWHSMRLIRTTLHAYRVCQHLAQLLYVAVVNRDRRTAIWAQLLDTYGQLSDVETLSLLKQSFVHRLKKNVRRFEPHST